MIPHIYTYKSIYKHIYIYIIHIICLIAIAAAGGCPSAIAVALWWLLRAGVARVGLVGVPFPCGAGRAFGGFGAFEAWQTAAMNAYKKPLLRPGGCLEPLLLPCGGFCLRAWRLLGLLGHRLPAKLGVVHAGVARVGLCARKRQAATLEQQGLTATGLGATGRRSIGSIVRV